MANPKRRHSHARGAKRRTHYKLEVPGLSRCKHCGATILPHRACPVCGYYRGRKYENALVTAENES
ncbi:MAG: 50S ribosomal protein L32 [Fimbriimonadales bacterium]|jgi:large subunit ribosomal protein L32|nr:50S ribosomal protein L32 [Armatimonadota bacterium]MCX7688342.1 50S ribosomal protein L32 [Fimbriimonadales bacterium]CUU07866.1 LSU ribosomal protein L32P [Armatimonadetes bacterium GBS]CUU34540.1 LSU ribosomal protein L32P [Armatimonadetes bacterium DC]CUU38012.1 LSU ribosomal protein L32P [Armatimonadetes bacterium GXS]GBC91189.1 50S ribosomal protein L32 [bacterium HR14]